MTTRAGGVSTGPWASLNLGRAVGDLPAAVQANRHRFAASLGWPQRARPGGGAAEGAPARPVWLHQVHGASVIELDANTPDHPAEPADAAWTRTAGIACVVGAADCLPVLFAVRDGRAVAAAHAGWRGLAAGVLEAVVRSLGRGAGARPADLIAWLGPCIGPRRFEVGADVLAAFGVAPNEANHEHFRYAPRPDGAPRWLADLQGLARRRLAALGVADVTADDRCTVEEARTFFSFRRAAGLEPSGRMAAAVWMQARR
ncbi:MAG: peptidoglycan editing factor PgeF [Rubrivivax sp.]|nr:peptidoglycan editing factor PgeF [Rubrivivax sp.]